MPDVADINNFSGKEGVRIVIELRKGADVEQNVNLLYKKAKLEDTFGYNAVLLSGGVPHTMSLLRILTEFVAFYRDTMTRKYKNLLVREKKAAEIKEGLITAVDCIDTIIEVLRGSSVVPMAKKCLTKGVTEGIKFRTKTCERVAKTFHFTEVQADAILDMRLQKLIGLEMTTLVQELDKCRTNIDLYQGLLTSKTKMNARMKADLLAIKKKYAVKRKTEIVDAEAVVLKKPEIKEEKVYALVNRFGYIKLIDGATYERNAANVEADYRFVCEVMNTGRLYLFTDTGRCHSIKAMAVPMGRYNDKGVPLEQVSGLTAAEETVYILSDARPKEKLLFVTASGLVKRVPLSEFDTARRTTEATKLVAGDKVVYVGVMREKQSAVLISRDGLCVAFDGGSVKLLKKSATGIIGMKFDRDDHVAFAAVADEDGTFTYEEKTYAVAALDAGKRATKGKKLR
jgi:DNA gyrase subunit A